MRKETLTHPISMRNMWTIRALIDIQGGYVIRGALPSRQLKLILAWCELHRDELMQNWELSKDTKPTILPRWLERSVSYGYHP